jgi:membrane protein
MKLVDRIDAGQKRFKPASVAVATFKKFSEDKTTTLAATIAFWGFFSIFPLFLVLVTVLGWVLPASDKENVLKHVASMFPLLDTSTITGLSGAIWPLILGLATALWSGMGAVRTVQNAFNSVWEIPYHERPGLLEQVGRSLFVLLTIGAGIVISTLITGFVTSNSTGVDLGAAGRIIGFAISIALDIGLFVAAFRLLTDREITTRDVLPGAVFSGIVFFILQEVSAFIISRHLKSAQPTYGRFATVITILWWFYLQSVVTLLGAQLNVVLKEGLYPRSLVKAPQTEADHRVLQAYAAERTYQPEERVHARVDQGGQGNGEGAAGPPATSEQATGPPAASERG